MAHHVTITDRVQAAGHDLSDMEGRARLADSSVPTTVTGVDGTVITGLSLSGDVAFEDLRTAITSADARRFRMAKHAGRHAAVFADAPAIALSRDALPDVLPEWGAPLSRWDDTPPAYVENYTQQLPFTQGHDAGTQLAWKHMNDLRALARQVGLSPQPARKTDLAAALMRHEGFLSTYGGPQYPECYPAYQRHGGPLVLRADAGAARIVIEALADAIEHHTLGLGDPTRPFSHSRFLYDTRDETPAVAAERERLFDWRDARMADLKPVTDALKAKGHRWFALGRPGIKSTKGQAEEVHYWLNGSSGYRTVDGVWVRKQPYGYYTLEELAAEKFLTDENSSPAP